MKKSASMTNIVLTNIQKKPNMTPSDMRRKKAQERAINFRKILDGFEGTQKKVLLVVNEYGDASTTEIITRVASIWGVTFNRKQVYNAIARLRKKGLIENYNANYKITTQGVADVKFILTNTIIAK